MFGVLLDVSGSMESAYSLDTSHDASVERTHAIFTSVSNIAKQEVARHERQEKIFVSAFGLSGRQPDRCDPSSSAFGSRGQPDRCDPSAYGLRGQPDGCNPSAFGLSGQPDGPDMWDPSSLRSQPNRCDLISLLKSYADSVDSDDQDDRRSGHDKLISLAEKHDAGHVEKWIRKYLSEYEANILYHALKDDRKLTQEMISLIPYSVTTGAVSGIDFIGKVFVPSTNFEEQRVHNSKAYKRAKEIISNKIASKLIQLDEHLTPRPVKEVSELFDRLLKKKPYNSASSASLHDEIQKLIEAIKPYIYGGTPMCSSLDDAENTFQQATTTGPKVLFILSDGEAADGDPQIIAERLRTSDVTIVTCFLTSEAIESRRLYSPDHSFDSKGKQWLFEMSSIMHNTHAPVHYLVDTGWELPSCGECRLFVQANSLDVVNELCETVVSQMTKDCDALVHLLEKVPLATYINQHNAEFEPKEQDGGTCYANAIAAVFHLAMSRIVGRDGGVPDFYSIRERLIKEYGMKGANTESVLAKVCPEYRLQYHEVDEKGARDAINKRRPVVAKFWLDNRQQWGKFSHFYRKSPEGVLKKNDVTVPIPNPVDRGGHAVVLIRCNRSCLTFMNSWGTGFADKGFFHVKDQHVLNDTRFFDVFWTLNDLKQCEKDAYEKQCTQRAREILDTFPSIGNLSHVCPQCNRGSKVRDFYGHILAVECPQCYHKFKPTNEALVKSLEHRQ